MSDVLFQERLKKLEELKEKGIPAYPNDFRPLHLSSEIIEKFKDAPAEELEKSAEVFTVAGRVMAIRAFGKAAFMHLKDRKGRIQVYFQKNVIGEEKYALVKKLDMGDIVGASGKLFRTKTGELTINVDDFRLLSKSLRPLPEKWHGLTDVELRYRQRYVDLMVNPEVEQIFRKRYQVIKGIRDFFHERDFLEVETPMMQQIPGGAAARPFITHHNALNMELYLRIAPELYLKRLVVGGIERVFEINRNFRNEGVSTRHNPEFTMLEFYQAYITYADLMNMTEDLVRGLAQKVAGNTTVKWGEAELDFGKPWARLTVDEAIEKYAHVARERLADRELLLADAKAMGLPVKGGEILGEIKAIILDAKVEGNLIQPTFLYDFPTDISPLSRRKDSNPAIVDRFELFVGGLELANAFSELNDPVDQRKRFEEQVEKRRKGDAEAQMLDEDYLNALEHAMPPTGGEGIGIDRLVMLLTNSQSIREVILFPLMRSEA